MNPGSLHDAAFWAAFWRDAVAAANADATLREYAQHLRDLTLRLEVGQDTRRLRIDHGAVSLIDSDAPASVTISGPEDEWVRLIRGEITYGQATNVVHGRLRIGGDLLAANWCVRPLWRLWRLTADMTAGGNAHV
jgi:putative sterol carrier protein